MTTLCIRTDNPQAELYLYEGSEQIGSLRWEGHRRLGETIHAQIRQLLAECSIKFTDLGRVVVYKGPGSFTGLRIGISVANTLAYGLGISCTGATGDDWMMGGIIAEESFSAVQPEYGGEVHITQQKK